MSRITQEQDEALNQLMQETAPAEAPAETPEAPTQDAEPVQEKPVEEKPTEEPGPTREEIAAAAAAEERAAAELKGAGTLAGTVTRELALKAGLKEKHEQLGDKPARSYDDGTVQVQVQDDGSIVYTRRGEDDPPAAQAPKPPEPIRERIETKKQYDKRLAEMEAGRARVEHYDHMAKNRPPPSPQELAARRRDAQAAGRTVSVLRPGQPLTALLEGNVQRDALGQRYASKDL